MEQDINNAIGVIQPAGHQNRIGQRVCGLDQDIRASRGIWRIPRGNHCGYEPTTSRPRAGTFEIVRGHSLFKMSAFEIALGCAANERSQLSTRR
jgi:hypothetical protein